MKHTIIIFFLGILLYGCGTEEEAQNINLEGPTVKVSASKVAEEAGGQVNSFMLNGTVAAQKTATISTRVMGTVTSMAVKEGQVVSQGQVLATISSGDLMAQKARIESQIAAAEIGLKNAERDYQRFKNLLSSQSVTQQEFNNMEMRYEVAKTNVTAAKEAAKEIEVQLGYARVTAPFSGRITQKMMEQGSMASPGMPLFTIASTGNMLIAVNVPASQMKHIQLNEEVKISIGDIDKELKGKISLMNPSATAQGQQYHVEVQPNAGSDVSQLLTGMNAKVFFSQKATAKTSDARVWLPKSALVQKGQLNGVYTVSAQQTAMLRWVQLGEEQGENVEVVSGLKPSDLVIMQAEGRLYNGVKITQ